MEYLKYLCESWQGLIQHLIHMVNHGYWYYQRIKPKKDLSEEEWLLVDKRLIRIFNLNQSKFQRYRRKKRGEANYAYIRYKTYAFLLKTKGEIAEGTESEVFTDIQEEPLFIEISGDIILKIGRSSNHDSFTCYLQKECFRSIKAELFDCLEHRRIRDLEYKFNALNNLPCYRGINIQKKELRKSLFRKAKTNHIKLDKEAFYIRLKRKVYKVFSDNNTNSEI